MKKLKLDELGRISVDQFRQAEKLPVRIMLDNIRSLHNVGSTFRTADAFSIEKIYLVGITGTPPHREIEKTALGATSSVEWSYHEDGSQLASELKKEGWKIVAVEQTDESQPLQNYHPSKSDKICLVFGNEIDGVSDSVIEQADMALEIPQSGTKHSLNISVCVGIVAWSLYKQRL